MAATRTRITGPRPASTEPRTEIPVVEFKDVSMVYDGGAVGLEHATMRIGRGEFVFLVGPTGCGKSTCIRLLLKEIEPSAGDVLIAGRSIPDMERKLVPHLRRNLGEVFKNYKLMTNRTV